MKVQGAKRVSSFFKCSAQCLFSDCPVEVDVIVHNESTVKAHVTFRGAKSVHSNPELRPVRAGDNKNTSGTSKHLYLEKVEKNGRKSV